MFQNGQKVVVVSGGDPTRVIKVRAGTGDSTRAPVVTTDGVTGRDQQVQIVSAGDSTRFPILNGVNPILGLSPAAYFKFNTGITVTGSGVSQWDDQSGNSRHLLQGTDAARPSKESDGSILFNGTAHFLKCGAFTLPQPVTIYLRMKQVTWVPGDTIFDGNLESTMRCTQNTSTPRIAIYAGTAFDPFVTDLAVNTYGAVCAVFNGASSSLQVDSAAADTGDPGPGTGGGFTLGCNGNTAGQFSHIQVKEVAIFSAAHDAATRSSVISYLLTL